MIDIYVLNTSFQIVGVIDYYESFIWTDRFYSYGDFELYTAFDPYLIELCKQDYYLWIKESEHMMIIEGTEVESDSESGNKLRITGRSLESIIDRRIVWQQMTIAANTTLQDAVKRFIDDGFLNPHPYSGNYSKTSDRRTRNATQLAISNKRKLNNLKFIPSEDEYILGLKVEKTEYTGDNIYDVIHKMLEEEARKTVGYKVTLNDQNEFVFQLYTGVDRSYAQEEYVKTEDMTINPVKTYYTLNDKTYTVFTGLYYELIDNSYVLTSDLVRDKKKVYYIYQNNRYVRYNGAFVTCYEKRGKRPFVVFSPQFDNVINSNYIDNISTMKNVTLVAGEGEGASRISIVIGETEELPRREFFTDARDMRTEDYGTGVRYTDALKKRGVDKLTENARVTSYEGKVEATRQFVYGKDFFMGDIIQMANEYGTEGAARVIEWVLSDSVDGLETYPTFDAVQVLDTTVTEEDHTEG